MKRQLISTSPTFIFRLVSGRVVNVLMAGCIAVAPLPAANRVAPKIPIMVNAAQRFQQIDGFGASTLGGFATFERGYFDQVVPKGVTYKTTPDQRTAILTTAIRELGLTHVRLFLPPEFVEPPPSRIAPDAHDWSAYDWAGASGKPASGHMLANRGNGLVEWGDFLRAAIPLGLKDWIVTPAVMPGWLLQKFTTTSPDRYEQYADWAAAHLLFLKQRFGFEAPFWSLHNEPDNLGWIDPVFWHQLIQTTGARFRKEGLATMLVVPDFMDAVRAVALVRAILPSDETRQYVGALAYHHYRTSGDGPQPFLDVTANPATANSGPKFEKITGAARAMAALGRKYHLPSWQTETGYYIKSYKMLSEWEIGRARANEIFYELSSGASAVEGMFLFWPDAVDPRYGASCRSEGHAIVLSTNGRMVKRWMISKDAGAVLGHYGRFVRSGDWRTEVNCDDPMIRATGFVSDQNRRCVLVVVNNSNQSKSIVVQLRGLAWRPGFSGALMTDSTKTLEPFPLAVPAAGDDWHLVLPSSSLCTFIWSKEKFGPLALPSGILRR